MRKLVGCLFGLSLIIFSTSQANALGGCNEHGFHSDLDEAKADFCANCESGDWVTAHDIYENEYEYWNYDEECGEMIVSR